MSKFKIGDMVYCQAINNKISKITKANEDNDVFLNKAGWFKNTGLNVNGMPVILHATQKNYELLSKLYPNVAFEPPPEFAENNLNNGWVRVNDELPELDEDVLVYTGICSDYAVAKLVKNDDFYRKNWTAYAKYDYLWVLTESFDDKVLGLMSLVQSIDDAKYWQPLPQPPKE